VLSTEIVFDMGESINPSIDIGQIEGAFVQGLGWHTTEEMGFCLPYFMLTAFQYGEMEIIYGLNRATVRLLVQGIIKSLVLMIFHVTSMLHLSMLQMILVPYIQAVEWENLLSFLLTQLYLLSKMLSGQQERKQE
jgi:hypothetical protein